MKIIEAKNLTYEYTLTGDRGDVISRVSALYDVNISVEKGQFIAVLGHNGSGKSTFAKHLNALLFPTGGEVIVNGFDTKNSEFLWDIRKSAGMVFQNPDNQLVATVVEEDIAFGPENLGVKPEEIRKRVDESLLAVKMMEYAKDSPHKLSGGQKQRIAIAGILAMKPDCIILDEPTAMLDPIGRREVMNTIQRLNKTEGITVIFITHYMDEAVLADKIFVMDNGKMVMSGTPKKIFSRGDEIKKLGLDVPQVTEVAGILKEEGMDIPEGILTVEEMVGAICRLKLKV